MSMINGDNHEMTKKIKRGWEYLKASMGIFQAGI